MVIVFFSIFLQLLIFMYMANKIHKRRFVKLSTNVFIFLLILGINCIFTSNGVSAISSILTVISTSIFTLFAFKNKFLIIVTSVIFFFIIVGISEFIISIIFYSIFGFFFTMSKPLIQFIAIITANLMAFVLTNIFLKVINFVNNNNLPKYSYFILVLPISTIMLLLSIEDYFVLITDHINIQIIILGLFASNIITIAVFSKAIESINVKNQLMMTQQKKEEFEGKYTLLEQGYKNNFNMLHNVLNICADLRKSFDIKSYEDTDYHISKLSELVFKEFNIIYTNSHVLNTVLSNNLSTINKYEIEIHTVILFNEFHFIQMQDLIDVFTSLIQHSISSCISAKSSERIIVLKTVKKSNRIIIQLTIPNNQSYLDLETHLVTLLAKYEALVSVSEDHNFCTLSIIFTN